MQKSEAHGGRSMLIVNELGYEVRHEVALEAVQGEQFFMEVGIELHVAEEL